MPMTDAPLNEREKLQSDLIAASDELARVALEPLEPANLGRVDRLVSDVNALLSSIRELDRRG